jgi:hypothetical protein
MPNVIVQNMTRNSIALPGAPPFSINDRQENGASMVDTVLKPMQARTINVASDELERVNTLLSPLIVAGKIVLSVIPHTSGMQRGLEPATNERAPGMDTFQFPSAAGSISLTNGGVATFNQQPINTLDVARTIQVVFAGWNGTSVTISGTLTDGSAYNEVITTSNGNTVQGSAGWANILNITGIGSLGTFNVENGPSLALSKRNLSTVTKVSQYTVVGGTSDVGIPGYSIGNGTIGLAPLDSAHTFFVWYV